jgi:hypothetical protein
MRVSDMPVQSWEKTAVLEHILCTQHIWCMELSTSLVVL